MRNSTLPSGVYRTMLLTLIVSVAAFAQRTPAQDPMDAAIQAAWNAQIQRNSEQAVAAREQAYALLQRVPATSPRYAGWAQQIAQFYQNAGWNSTSRQILQDAVTRTANLPDAALAHLSLLNTLAQSWQQDGNLLQAGICLEQAASLTIAAARPQTNENEPVQIRSSAMARRRDPLGNIVFAYSRLADLYRQLGRPDAIAAVAAKLRAAAPDSKQALAQFYEQNGPLEEAEAIYRTLAEQATGAREKTNAWQSLANLKAREQQFREAAAAIQNAMAAAQASDDPNLRNQANSMRQNLAEYLRQAGQIEQADQVFAQSLQQVQGTAQESGALAQFAHYLSQTDRAAQGESLLTTYLAGASNLEPQQKSQLLFTLSSLSRRRGDAKASEEYQKAGAALLPLQPSEPVSSRILVGPDMQAAQIAVNEHRWDDAYTLALRALSAAPQAVDDQQLQWDIPRIAGQLAGSKQPAMGERLFQGLLTIADASKTHNSRSLVEVSQAYVRFLVQQPDRSNDIAAAIRKYRDVLIEVNGADSATLAEAVRLQIEAETAQSHWNPAENAARDLLALQESFSGTTSNPYLRDLEIAARVYQSAGEDARALPLLRQAITISDLHTAPNDDWRRDQTRMNAAMALSHLGQYDEAIALGEEALALERPARSPHTNLAQELDQIRRAKQFAATRQADSIHP